MPIKREQFERGLDDTEQRMVEFLSQHREQAFTLAEISQGIGRFVPQAPQSQGIDVLTILTVVADGFVLSQTLNGLVTKGIITAKIIGGREYYTSKS